MFSLPVFDGVPRTQQQIQATSGGLLGEVDKDGNCCTEAGQLAWILCLNI